MVDRRTTLELLRRFSATRLGERLILCGSSGIHAASAKIPAMTEDVDLLIDAEWLAANQQTVVAEMEKAGFHHVPGTSTLDPAEGPSVDLVGYSPQDRADRIGGGEALQVMVFGDLSTLLAAPGTVVGVATGGQALSTAALATSKLLTVRLEKGNKDKLQALLLIEENAEDEEFLSELRRLLGLFDLDRVRDAFADAQLALLTILADNERSDPQTKGYFDRRAAADRGLAVLKKLISVGEESRS